MESEVAKIDPLKTLDIEEVQRRTGFSERDIHRRLADDKINSTPGRRFARPMCGGKRKKYIWREITLVRWMERSEALA